jgi:hypothetical protein
MKKQFNYFDLVLKCLKVGTELLKFAKAVVAFLNTVFNYSSRYAFEMVHQVRAETG